MRETGDMKALSDVCLICFSDLGTNMRAKLPCGHDDMCGICHLRLRHLHEDKKCPICKQTNDTIVVDEDDSKDFESYPRWGDDIGAGFVYKKDVGMFFEEKYYNQARFAHVTYLYEEVDRNNWKGHSAWSIVAPENLFRLVKTACSVIQNKLQKLDPDSTVKC